MLHARSPVLLAALAGVLLLSGCRTYGGYDTEPKTYQALQKAVQSFETELDRAESDLHRLEEAAADSDTLRALGKQFHTFLEEHRSLLETQQQRLDRLSPESTYRNLHAAYGATVTEQRLMRQKYQRTIRTVRAVVQGRPADSPLATGERRYTIQPVGFPDPGSQTSLTMQQALQGR